MIDASKALVVDPHAGDEIQVEQKKEDLIKEATGLLKRLADRGHPDAQYFLADCYANGIGTARSKQDFDRAFPLFMLAAKHGHPDAAYRSESLILAVLPGYAPHTPSPRVITHVVASRALAGPALTQYSMLISCLSL